MTATLTDAKGLQHPDGGSLGAGWRGKGEDCETDWGFSPLCTAGAALLVSHQKERTSPRIYFVYICCMVWGFDCLHVKAGNTGGDPKMLTTIFVVFQVLISLSTLLFLIYFLEYSDSRSI